MNKFFIFLFLFLSIQLSAKIRLLTFHFNRPELIDLQYRAFKKFMLDEYEWIVFNDADNEEDEELIRKRCEKYGIRCVRYEQQWHFLDPINAQVKDWMENPNYDVKEIASSSFANNVAQHPTLRHGHVVQYALNHFGYNHDDIIAIVDCDLFPIRSISLYQLLTDCPIVGIQKFEKPHSSIDYLALPFIALDCRRLPDHQDLKFHLDIIDNELFDGGAHSYYYLKNHPEVKVAKFPQTNQRHFSELPLDELYHLGFRKEEAALIKELPWPFSVEFHMDNHFIHFGSCSSNIHIFKKKLKCVNNLLNTLGKDD